MKYGKLIQAFEKTLPEWENKYLAYKLLKRLLKFFFSRIPAETVLDGWDGPEFRHRSFSLAVDPERAPDADLVSQTAHATIETGIASSDSLLQDATGGDRGNSKGDGTDASQRGRKRKSYVVDLDRRGTKRRRLSFRGGLKLLMEMKFKSLLKKELKKLNDYFLEKEEEYVIRLDVFKERAKKVKEICKSVDENYLDVINMRKDVVVFHGEMVLLRCYSAFNYTGLVKIVKKYDKLSGGRLRSSFIPDVLRQPFYITEQLSSLVQDCEENLLTLFPKNSLKTQNHSSDDPGEEGDLHEVILQEEATKSIHNGTLAALKTVQHMGRGSSTYNPYSIPPCSPSNSEDQFGTVVDDDTSSISTAAS